MSCSLETDPVGVEEFAALMDRFAPLSSKLALAISGGADSMALALCAQCWAGRDLVALIVEHGLRPESAAEAAEVMARLQGMGMQAMILSWVHDPLSSKVEDSARQARYGLLLGACEKLGAQDLLVAHHRDDQAETIVMRLSKGSGVDGLAGIPAQSMRGNVRILRPFLSVPKSRLVATCANANLPFVTDPTNDSEKYARGRLRRISHLLEAEGMTSASLALLGERAAEAKEALDFYAKEFLLASVNVGIGGTVEIDRAALSCIPLAVGLRCLSACLRYVHDTTYSPEHAALSALLKDITCGEENIRTLGGCLISISKSRVYVMREPAAATEVLPTAVGETALWDGRWLVSCGDMYKGLFWQALGSPPHDELDKLAPDLRRKVPQGRARASLPAIWNDDILVAIPSFDGKEGDARAIYYSTDSLLRPIFT